MRRVKPLQKLKSLLTLRKSPFCATSFLKSPYHDLYNKSISNPTEFWSEPASQITWSQDFTKVLDFDINKSPSAAWFKNGKTNMAYNCLDRHDPNLIALKTDSAVTGKKEIVSYGELTQKVACCCKALPTPQNKKALIP